jgi:formate-dependent nitrite reductase membrane component NrfD
MPEKSDGSRRHHPLFRAVVEITFIVFLFYANLLMGEFNAASGRGKTLTAALHDIFTAKNFTIAICSAIIGYLVFDYMRRKS